MGIYCDKCKKEGVIDSLKTPPSEPTYTMEDVVSGKNERAAFVNADIKWHTRILKCPYCGYNREYEYGSGGLRPVIIEGKVENMTGGNFTPR